MAEITTAAELEALPVGVVLLDRGQFPVWRETHFGWRTANGGTRVESDLIILDGAPLTVLYRPDRPAQPTVQPTVETLALVVHRGWQGYECTCGLDDLGPVERETVTRIAGAVLDAIRGEQP